MLSDLILPAIIILLLIALNGMFVAAEFAIIGVRPSRIVQLAEEGNAAARRIRAIIQDARKTDRYIASAQLGITLASLGLGMYGEPAIAHVIEPPLHDWFGITGDLVHTISFFIALGLITYLHVVVGEMVPKSLALQDAERVVLRLASPMLLMQSIFSIPITILNGIGAGLLRVLGVKPPDATSRLHTPNELALLISDSVSGGMMGQSDQELLTNIFDFAELTVGQVMTPRNRMDGVPATISRDALLERMFTSPHSRLPVYEGNLDHILGIIHLKDLVHHYVEGTAFDIHALMHEVPFVPEGGPADQLLQQLREKQVHMAIVVDEYGSTAGLVTFEDLIEEIVGDVRDEFDTHEMQAIEQIAPGHLRVRGRTRLDELAPYVQVPVREDRPIETIGGVVMSALTLPLKAGDHVELDGIRLEVLAVDGMAVTKVGIRYPPQEPD